MKIILFDGIGKVGIVSGWKPHITNDAIRVEADRDGELWVGGKLYNIVNGITYVPTFTVIMGESYPISFVDKDGERFECGTITRTGSHMIKITNPVEACIVELCGAYEKLVDKVAVLEGEIKKIKNEYGITIV